MQRNRPSSTALRVARAVAFLALDPLVAAMLPPDLAAVNERLLTTSGLLSDGQRRRLARPLWRRLSYFADSLFAPGQLLFVGIRKRLVFDEALAAIGSGCRQLLVIGGGLDTLALRLARAQPQLAVVEVDHPASQAVKREALARLGPLPPNLSLAAADLAAGELSATLAAVPTWDSAAPTLAVAEAVLMYLPPAAVELTLRQLHAATAAGSAILFSYIQRDRRGRPLLGRSPRLAALALAASGEPLRWWTGEGELGGLLGAAGWHLEVAHFDLRARYLVPAGLEQRPLADIEVYARARRG